MARSRTAPVVGSTVTSVNCSLPFMGIGAAVIQLQRHLGGQRAARIDLPACTARFSATSSALDWSTST